MSSNVSLSDLRQRIDALDDQLLRLLADRMAVSRQIGVVKQQQKVAVVQPQVAEQRLQRLLNLAADCGLSDDFIRAYWQALHAESCRQQNAL